MISVVSKHHRLSKQLLRRFSTKESVPEVKAVSREVRREMRKRASSQPAISSPANVVTPAKEGTSPWPIFGRVMGLGSFAGAVTWFGLLDEDSKKNVTKSLSASFLGSTYRFVETQVQTIAKPFTDPSRDKLIPDWPLPGVPPNTPEPPTLILDLEDTLVHSEWDRKYGWRHAKRPGVDKFLETVSKYYEVVVFSKQMANISEGVIFYLDQKGYITHKLYRDSTRYMNGTHVKDIKGINRNLNRVIIIDDDPDAYQLQKRNAIPIKPYLDGTDQADDALANLLPFLTAVATENIQNVPQVLDEFRNEHGVIEDLPSKYASRVYERQQRRQRKQQKGLGGFIRGRVSIPK